MRKKLSYSNFMKSKISKKSIFILFISFLIAVFLNFNITNHEIKLIKKSSFDAFDLHVQLVENYVKAFESAITRFSLNMEDNLQLPAYPRDLLSIVEDRKVEGSYGSVDNNRFSGEIQGKGQVKKLETGVKKEIVSALMVDNQVQIIRKYFPDVLWIYYISSKEFIYLSPRLPQGTWGFDSKFYKKPFWIYTNPQNNPNFETTISPLYEDTLGRGLMITVSSPVVVKGEFKGVFSLDLGIEDLKTLLNTGNHYGETVILSKDLSLAAKFGEMKLGDKFEIPQNLLKKGELYENNIFWKSKSINDGWLTLVHKLDMKKVIILALKNTYYEWIIVVLFILLEYMVLKLVSALKSVEFLVNMDPLTNLANRRGFYLQVENLQKEKEKLALVIMDVDYFKKINDNFGHAIGDGILQKMGTILNNYNKNGNITCRWGGEEFILLLSYKTEEAILDEVKSICRRVTKEIKDPSGSSITVSAGIEFWYKGQNIDKIIAHADDNLYKAKEAGRNAICYDNKIYNN